MQDRSEAGEGRRLTKGQQSRRSILEAALRVIAKGGVDALTHRRLAAEAGVTHGTITYHFASRDEIVLEAFREYIRAFGSKLATLVEEGGREGWTLVELLVESHRRQFVDPVRILAEYELILYAARNGSLGREYRAWQRGLDAQLAVALEDAGAPRPLEAASIVSSLTRAFELECITDPSKPAEELGRRLEMLLPSLLPGA